jgi:ABC-type transport system involved in multi-copper enzyme maturation permease subunit
VKAFAFVLAVAFFIIALLYLLGYLQFGTSHPGRHVSHAVLFAILGVLSLVWMRFQPSPASAR